MTIVGSYRAGICTKMCLLKIQLDFSPGCPPHNNIVTKHCKEAWSKLSQTEELISLIYKEHKPLTNRARL